MNGDDSREDPSPELELDQWLAYSEPLPAEHAVRDPTRLVPWIVAALVIVGIVLLLPTGKSRLEAETALDALGVPSQLHEADVVRVADEACPFDPEATCRSVDFVLAAGPHVGERYTQEFTVGGLTPEFSVGKKAVLSYVEPNGTVLASVEVPCSFDPTLTCRELSVNLADNGTVDKVEVVDGEDASFALAGDAIDLTIFEADGEFEIVGAVRATVATQYQFADFQRRSLLWLVTAGFAIAVVALGRWRGLAALAGLAASVGVLLLFVLPAILDGRGPVLVALVGAVAIAFLALYATHGFRPMTNVALAGTVGALVLTALLSWLVVSFAEISGFASEEATLLTLFDGIDVRGLVLAGIVLGAAGALDDVTVTQASAVWQLRAANPSMSRTELLARGIEVGRDHIASTVNTLLLAYAGAALPLLVLLVLSQQSLGSVINSEIVAVEAIRTLIGSIGLVAAVPLTTWLAALVASVETSPGVRSLS